MTAQVQSSVKEFDRVKVTADFPEEKVRKGFTGTVMNLFAEDGFAVVELDDEHQAAAGYYVASVPLRLLEVVESHNPARKSDRR